MTTEEPPLSASSPLDKPLHLLTEDDISQITREQCRRFLSQKGMRRPSWNKSQAIQQVIMLKALIEPSPESDDIVALLLDNGADVNSRNYCGQICRYKEHRWDLKQLVGSGGMPSSHSATVTSLAVAVGLHDGLGGSTFATALILACILVFFVFNPALVASNLASTITFESLISLWFMPVNILFTFIIGSALGWVLMIIAKPPQHLKGLILGTCSAGNLGNLLLIIIPAVYDATGVRLHAGRQAELLNQIVYELPAEHPLAESRPLHELLGHTPPQMMTLISKEAIE